MIQAILFFIAGTALGGFAVGISVGIYNEEINHLMDMTGLTWWETWRPLKLAGLSVFCFIMWYGCIKQRREKQVATGRGVKASEILSRMDVEALSDGDVVELPILRTRSGTFVNIVHGDHVIIKMPNENGKEDFERFVVQGSLYPSDIRERYAEERTGNIADFSEKYGELYRVWGAIPNQVFHMMLVWKAQYERVRQNGFVHIPRTKFVVLKDGDSLEMGVVQEKIRGDTLWELYDGEQAMWRNPRLVREVAPKILGLLGSELRDDINWNIMNFIVRKNGRGCDIYYVDNTPSIMFSSYNNNVNIENLRRDMQF